MGRKSDAYQEYKDSIRKKYILVSPRPSLPFFLIISPINPIRLLKTENKMKA